MRLPSNLDAERAVLGTILLNNETFYQATSLLPQTFSLSGNQLVWAAMLDLHAEGRPIDMVTLADRMARNDEIEKAGGVAYLSSLIDGVPERASIDSYVEIVRDRARRRWLSEQCDAVKERLCDDSRNTAEALELMEEAALRVRADAGVRSSHHVKEIVPEVLNELERIRQHQGLIGFTTGVPGLDNATTGIRPDEYWVIGARPSRGKTVLGVQIVASNAELGVPVLMFSFEMMRRAIVRRLIPKYSGISAWKVRDPRYCSQSEMLAIEESAARMAQWPLWVVDPDGMKASDVVAAAKFHIHRNGVRLIVLDYLQILRGLQKELKERVAACSNALRAIPKTEGVPVVALSQLRRLGDENALPTMADLKESGDIEAHAHTILLLYRKMQGTEWTGEDQIIIGKQREGLVGHEDVTLHSDRLWFVSREVPGRHSEISDEYKGGGGAHRIN